MEAVLRREIIFLDVAICHSLIYKIKKPIGSTEAVQDRKINTKVNQASSS